MITNGRLQLYPFLRVALSLVAGIVAGVALHGAAPSFVWLVAAIGALMAFIMSRHHGIIQSCLLWTAVFAVGGLLSSHSCDGLSATFPNDAMPFRAVVTSRPVVSKKTVSCDMAVIIPTGGTVKIKASFLRCPRAETLRAGQGLEAFSVIRQPENLPKSAFDYRRYLLFHGYKGVSFILPSCWRGCAVGLDSLSLVGRWRVKALVLRESLLERYSDFGSVGQGRAVLSAMTLGDRTAVSSALADDYSVSGAAHVLALSGLHLGIIFTVLTFIFSRLRFRPLSFVLVVFAVWAYVFVVGMPPSVMRAAVMLTIYSFVSLLNRDSLPLNTLSLSAVALLAACPLDVFDVSFQMSFLSVAAILLLFRPLCLLLPLRWRRVKAVNSLWQLACLSIAAQAAVAPLVAFYFGRFSSYFLLTNFFVIPVATLILYGAVLLVLTAPLPIVHGYVAAAMFRLAEWLNAGVSFIASLPGASVEGLRLSVAQVLFCYVFIAAVSYILLRLPRLFWFSRRPLDNISFPDDGCG